MSYAWREAYTAKDRRPPTDLELQPFAVTVGRAPRWSWGSLGRTEVESRLHYIARLSAGAPEPYSCGVRACEACVRAGMPTTTKRERQPGEDG